MWLQLIILDLITIHSNHLIEIIKNEKKQEPYWKATDIESDVCIALFFEREWPKRIHEAGE